MKNGFGKFLGGLLVSLISGGAFGDTSTSLAGRTYADASRNIKFLTEDNGLMLVNGREVEFSYRQEDQIVDFEGDDLNPEFMRSWFVKRNGKILVAADNRITLSLLSDFNFSCGSPSPEHGRVIRMEHIRRPFSCPYPWDRYHYEDGFTCDNREACH